MQFMVEKPLESKRAILKHMTSSYLKVYDPREKLFYTVNGFIQQWVVGTRQVAIRGRTVQHQLSRPWKQEVNPEVNFFLSFVACSSPFRHPYSEYFSLYLHLFKTDRIKRDKYCMRINCWLNYSFIFPKLYRLTFSQAMLVCIFFLQQRALHTTRTDIFTGRVVVFSEDVTTYSPLYEASLMYKICYFSVIPLDIMLQI